ncbi:hypothetical protein LTSEWAN_1331, partial [Salmonella enterica subsp. enterica serovar Wandsworth str. A4-580]
MLADQVDAAWRLNRVGGRVAENFSLYSGFAKMDVA